MIIVDDQWCLISPPKTAGTSARWSFPPERTKYYVANGPWWDEYVERGNLDGLPQATVNAIKEGFEVVKHAPLAFWQELQIINNKHSIFYISRNPYTKLVSYYYEVLISIPGANFSLKDFTLGRTSVNQAIEALGRKELLPTARQVDFLLDNKGRLRLDRNYKLEADLEALKQDFGLAGFKHSYQNNYSKDWSGWYDDELIDFVRATFAEDFETFGYDASPFWR